MILDNNSVPHAIDKLLNFTNQVFIYFIFIFTQTIQNKKIKIKKYETGKKVFERLQLTVALT